VAKLSRSKWPADGPVRELLSYLDTLHARAGYPSLSDIGRALALAPSTLSAFFTGARLISRGNLELLVEHLEGDMRHAELLRRRAAAEWMGGNGSEQRPVMLSELDISSGSRLDIVVYAAPVNTLNRPDRLVGRDDLIDRVDQLLDGNERVMLHGLGGSGKTALAATVADRRVEAGKGRYLWLRPGDADVDAVLDGLARTVSTSDEHARIAAATGDAQLQAIRQMLAQYEIRLLVIDDVWTPQVLHTVLRVAPDDVAALITSRLKIDVGQLIDVGDLVPEDAVTLLGLHARRTLPPDAVELCRELGQHPYALEIAGRHLRQYDMSPSELRRLLKNEPHALKMPGGFSSQGRESIQRLLDRSVQALDSADAKHVLNAIAAFTSGTATIELLSTHLGFDPTRAQLALNRLVDISLAKRIPGTSAYSVHDLTFAYARSMSHEDGLPAIVAFVHDHIRDYQLLAVEMSNLLGAAAVARSTARESFLAIVEALAVGGYLDDYGHTLGLLRLLDDAIDQVREDPDRCHILITKRGNAAYNQGEHELAIQLYVRALDLTRTPDRRIILMSLMGKILAELSRYDEADEQFDQAYRMAETTGDQHSRLRILEQHSVAAFWRNDYEKVRELAREGLELSRRLGARFQEAIFLNNLGTAEFELGVRLSTELHEQAQDIAGQLDNDHLRALTHRTLGADYQALEQFEPARNHFLKALELYARLGQAGREAKLRRMLEQFGYVDGRKLGDG